MRQQNGRAQGSHRFLVAPSKIIYHLDAETRGLLRDLRASVVNFSFLWGPLPDPASRFANHGRVGFALVCLLELGHVSDHAVDSESPRRVLIDPRHHAGELRTVILAPDLAPADEQTLLGGEAVNGLLRSAAEHIQQSHVCKAQAAIVGSIFAQRQLSANVNVIHRNEAVVLVDEASLQLIELLAVLGSPPVAQVSLSIELAARIVEPMREFVADDRANGAEVH